MAAEQGYSGAQNNLGTCYLGGEGVEQNYEEAVRWYSLAAEQENAYAQCNLGNCYKDGKGVEQDKDKAIEWYRKASDNGCEEAKEALDELLKRRQ